MQRWFWRLTPVAISLVAFLWPLWYWNRTPGGDWGYFDSLALVVRSSVHTYGRFPMHDPWVMGGADLLANPQTRVFSPFGLLDQIFRPHLANVVSLVIHGVFGAWGMIAVLTRLGHNHIVAGLGSLMFIGGSWFMLHFCEGHVPYGSMQLLPWVIYWLLELDRPAAILKLAALLALFLVDGGMYAFIFSVYGALVFLALGMVPLRGLVASVAKHRLLLPGAAVAFLGVASAKLVPVIESLGTRKLTIERATMGMKLAMAAFYDTDQWFLKGARPLDWRFHEVGCYLGFAATALILVALARPPFARAHWRWLAFGLVFLWVGTNVAAPFNPWELISRTPLLRNAHVQSRNFIWLYFAWVVLLCAAVRSFRWKPTISHGLLAAAVLEIVIVSQRQWYRAMHNDGGKRRYESTARDITQRTWAYTVMWATKPDHYFAGGYGALDTYEPAQVERNVRYRGGPGYAGEIRVVGGNGSAELREVSPGYIAMRYEGTTPAMVRINQNRLAGWEVVSGDAQCDDDDYSLDVKLASPGEIVLRYHPWYWPDVVMAYVLGILVFAGMGLRLRQRATT